MLPITDLSEVLLELGLSASVTDEERAVAATCLRRAEGAARRYLHYDPVRGSRTEYYPLQNRFSATGNAVWEVTDTEAVMRNLAVEATSELQLRHVPVRSITSLNIDYDGRSGTAIGAFAASTLKVEGTDFWPNYDGLDSGGEKICHDGILRAFGSWPTTPGCVRVVYVAGYTAEELRGQDSVIDASPVHAAVLSDACRRVRRMFAGRKRTGIGWVSGALTGERLGDYGYTVDPGSASDLSGPGELSEEAKAMLEPFRNYGIGMEG